MSYSNRSLGTSLKHHLGILSAIALTFPLIALPSMADIVPIETSPSPSPTSSPNPTTSPNPSPTPSPTSSPTGIPDTKPNDKAANPTDNKTARFSCQMRDNQYIVMYQPKSQPQKYFPWAAPSAMGDGWSPERRCTEISRRLESYRPDGLLEMRTSTENGYNIICATTDKNSSCRIVLTVPNGQDPVSTRDRVFANLTTADSGQQTTAVNTFQGRDRSTNDILGNLGLGGLGIDLNGILGSVLSSKPSAPTSISGNGLYLKPFLDPSDGGTGTGLNNSNFTDTSGKRLNPDNFR